MSLSDVHSTGASISASPLWPLELQCSAGSGVGGQCCRCLVYTHIWLMYLSAVVCRDQVQIICKLILCWQWLSQGRLAERLSVRRGGRTIWVVAMISFTGVLDRLVLLYLVHTNAKRVTHACAMHWQCVSAWGWVLWVHTYFTGCVSCFVSLDAVGLASKPNSEVVSAPADQYDIVA